MSSSNSTFAFGVGIVPSDVIIFEHSAIAESLELTQRDGIAQCCAQQQRQPAQQQHGDVQLLSAGANANAI